MARYRISPRTILLDKVILGILIIDLLILDACLVQPLLQKMHKILLGHTIFSFSPFLA